MALILNGSTQSAIGATVQPIAAKPFTLSAWIKSTSVAASQSVVAYGDGSNDIYLLQARGAIVGDPIAAMEYDGAWKIADTSSGFSAGTWHHVAATFVGDTERNSFIDGGSKGTNTDSQSADIDGAFRIRVGTHSGSAGFFAGKIASVAMWSSELSDANILLLANGSVPSDIEAGTLEGYWPLLNNYEDSSANENDLQGVGEPTFDATDNPLVTYSELTGTIAAVSAVTGNIVSTIYSSLTGTIAAVSTVGPSSLGSTTVGLTVETVFIKRLVAAGNDQIYYEAI